MLGCHTIGLGRGPARQPPWIRGQMRPGHPAGTAHLALHPLSGTAPGSAIGKGEIQAHRTRHVAGHL